MPRNGDQLTLRAPPAQPPAEAPEADRHGVRKSRGDGRDASTDVLQGPTRAEALKSKRRNCRQVLCRLPNAQ
eukprot:11661432-Alexandrium_andersonii.AAC.1